MAQDLASTNSRYSTQEILQRSLDITASVARRLKVKKVSAWHVAMAEEKALISMEVRQPLVGKGLAGRKGFDGRYAQHVAAAYRDPEKREHYQQRAKEINAETRVGSLNPLLTTQKHRLKRLTTYLTELSHHDMHLVLMVVPSKAKPVLFTTSGFAASYYKLLSKAGWGQDQFITICQGGTLLQEAAGLPSGTTVSLKRNGLRSENITMLKDLISKALYHDIAGSTGH